MSSPGIELQRGAYDVYRIIVPSEEESLAVNVLLTTNSIHITGKPAEIIGFLANLSKTYSTLGDLLPPAPSGTLTDRSSCRFGETNAGRHYR